MRSSVPRGLAGEREGHDVLEVVVADRDGVGVAERSHGDLVRRPHADAGDLLAARDARRPRRPAAYVRQRLEMVARPAPPRAASRSASRRCQASSRRGRRARAAPRRASAASAAAGATRGGAEPRSPRLPHERLERALRLQPGHLLAEHGAARRRRRAPRCGPRPNAGSPAGDVGARSGMARGVEARRGRRSSPTRHGTDARAPLPRRHPTPRRAATRAVGPDGERGRARWGSRRRARPSRRARTPSDRPGPVRVPAVFADDVERRAERPRGRIRVHVERPLRAMLRGMPRQSLWEDLTWRGLVHQTTSPDLAEKLDTDFLTTYIGFDPTADSLHIGSLLQLTTMRRLQLAGHRVVGLIGGGTGLVGDPSGRDTERQLLDDGTLERNSAAIRAQIERFFDGPDEGLGSVVLRDNADWLRELRVTEFLRDIGKHLHRQRDDPQGVGQGAARGPRPGHQLHRVQLHAAAGLRLPAPLRHRRLHAAARRQRPVGQHHRRHRPDPPAARPASPTDSRRRW